MSLRLPRPSETNEIWQSSDAASEHRVCPVSKSCMTYTLTGIVCVSLLMLRCTALIAEVHDMTGNYVVDPDSIV